MGRAQRSQVQRWRDLLDSERDAAALYARLAQAETGERRSIFEELAAIERRHAGHWEGKLRGAGARIGLLRERMGRDEEGQQEQDDNV